MVFLEGFGDGASEVVFGDDFFLGKGVLGIFDSAGDKIIGGAGRDFEATSVEFEGFFDFLPSFFGDFLSFHSVVLMMIRIAMRR